MIDLFSPDVLVPQALDHARALAARFYVDSRMPALDARAVFARSWQLVCHQSQLSGVGHDDPASLVNSMGLAYHYSALASPSLWIGAAAGAAMIAGAIWFRRWRDDS